LQTEDLDIDSLLQDLDDAVEMSPQHSKGKYQGVTQENLHPQNVLRNAFNDEVFLNKNDSDGGTGYIPYPPRWQK